jgi:ATP-dependent HslUV protease ATP-binding subunit HslU
LVEQYRAHEPSRESIELALDDILQEKIKNRQKFGFKPPQRGKRGEAQGDEERISLWQQVRRRFEPSVPLTTLVNDGSVFAALGAWAAWQASSSDPTLPLGAAICFCAWKLHDKRSKRDPDGPHWGGNPVWGALVSTILGLMMGGLLAYAAAMYAPLPPRVGSEAVGMLLIALMLGFTAIYLK